jgi:hypothetical protein
MPEEQIQKTEQPTAAFVLSLLAGLWMLGAEGMMGGFGWGGVMGAGKGCTAGCGVEVEYATSG